MTALRIALLAAAAALAASSASAEEMRPGKWQITMKSTGEGAGDFTMTQCMNSDALSSQMPTPGAENNEGDYEMDGNSDGCSYHIQRVGNVTTMDNDCGGEKTTVKMTMTSDSYTMVTEMPDATMTMTGKRIGDC